MTTRVSAVVFLLTGLIAGMMAAALDAAWAGKVKFAALTTPGEQVIAWFGWSVQSVGDLNGDAAVDWAVSAPQQTVDGVGQQGAVLIFSGSDTRLLFTLRDPVPGAQATFGEAVSPVDDVNGDGVADLVAGARLQSVGGNDGQGQAYVFSGVDGVWLGVTLAAPVPQASAFFGASLATIGDRNQDGRSDVVVGAPQQSFGGIDGEGAAYLMSPATGELLAVIMHPSPQAGASFGFAVASVGDLDGDSVFDFVISAPFQAVSGNISQGQVYAFSGHNTQLLYTVNAPESLPSGRLGFAVTAIGDVNDDGVDDLVVGAPTADVPAVRNQGRVFIVSGGDGTVLHALTDPTPLENGFFGAALASPGDIDGDGIDDVAVGSPAPVSDSLGIIHPGEVLLFSGASGEHLLTVDDPAPDAGATFGFSLSAAGDVDADGVPDLLSGAPFHDVTVGTTTVQAQGEAFVIRKLAPDLKAKVVEATRTGDVSGRDRLDFRVEVRNRGTVKTTVPFRIEAHISNDAAFDGGTLDPMIAGWSVEPPLLPGDTVVLGATVEFGESVEGTFLLVRADSGMNITELKEGNNVKSFAVGG